MAIVYECPRVQKKVEADQFARAKVEELHLIGDRTSNHGRIKLLNADHAHVVNNTAVAFRWNDDDLEIVGYGEKGKGKPVPGSGGYSWTSC